MMNTQVLINCTLQVIAFGVFKALYSIYLHPLRKYPGPTFAICSSLYYYYWSYRGKLHLIVKNLQDQYGDVVRISPNMLVYRNPQAWKDICGHRKSGAAPFVKDQEFYAESITGHTLLSTPSELDHSRQRRLLSHAFSEKALKEQEPLLQSYVDLLVRRLHEHASTQQSIDMTSWYNYTTFDIIGDLAFGEPFNCLQDSHCHPWVKAVFPSLKGAVLLRPFLLLPKQLGSILVPQWLKKMRDANFIFAKEKVNHRLSIQTTRPDFMTYILRHNNERGMGLSEMQANAGLLIIAGSETTATLLSGCTFYLLKHPTVYDKLIHEIRGTFEKETDITFQSVANLQYLHAVLEESLRLYPPVPAILPRTVPEGGAFINGDFVPEGV
jgi:cytochrome P450